MQVPATDLDLTARRIYCTAALRHVRSAVLLPPLIGSIIPVVGTKYSLIGRVESVLARAVNRYGPR